MDKSVETVEQVCEDLRYVSRDTQLVPAEYVRSFAARLASVLPQLRTMGVAASLADKAARDLLELLAPATEDPETW